MKLNTVHFLGKITSIAVLALMTSACFEESVLIKVNKDGSGLVQQQSYTKTENLMKSLLEGLGGASNQSSNELEYNDAFFEQKASEMGEGVSVESWKLDENALGFKGYEAIYKFDDINALSVSASPDDLESNPESSSVDTSSLEAKHYFSMENGRLTIHTPEPESEEKQNQTANQVNDQLTGQMLSFAGNMLRGARVQIRVEGLDEIKESNARHRSDNTITLLDARIDELLNDPDLLQEVQNFSALSREEAQAVADRVDGLDVDTQAQIVIQF